MIKKEYMQPAVEVLATDMEGQLLTGTVKSVSSDGLDDEETIKYLENIGNPLTDAV